MIHGDSHTLWESKSSIKRLFKEYIEILNDAFLDGIGIESKKYPAWTYRLCREVMGKTSLRVTKIELVEKPSYARGILRKLAHIREFLAPYFNDLSEKEVDELLDEVGLADMLRRAQLLLNSLPSDGLGGVKAVRYDLESEFEGFDQILDDSGDFRGDKGLDFLADFLIFHWRKVEEADSVADFYRWMDGNRNLIKHAFDKKQVEYLFKKSGKRYRARGRPKNTE